MAATGGLSYRQWIRLVERKRLRTTAEAVRKARAIRDQPVVEAALAALEQVRADGDAAVLGTRVELASATRALLRHGAAAAAYAAGVDEAELRRYARRPRPIRRPPAGVGTAAG